LFPSAESNEGNTEIDTAVSESNAEENNLFQKIIFLKSYSGYVLR
jgi:hypothetical protein